MEDAQWAREFGRHWLHSYDRLIAARTPTIGVLNEGSLHAALKARYTEPGDQCEARVDGFVIDICRPDLLVEIQTAGFRFLRNKLDRLLDTCRVLLVHPIAAEIYLQRSGRKVRKSPRRGSVYELFEELVSIPTLLDHPNLSLEIVMVSVTHVQKAPRRGRRRFRTIDRHLREVLQVRRFASVRDLAELLPRDLPAQFTTADIATRVEVSRPLAQSMAFCLRAMEVIEPVGRKKSGIRYRRCDR